MKGKQEVKQLLTKLESGIAKLQTSEGWKSWLSIQSRLHNYSWNNTILILSQCPNATAVMGYQQWKHLGRQVRKGQKSIRILAPCFKKIENDKGEKEKKLMYFRVVAIFDISQTDGPEIPKAGEIEGTDNGLFEQLKAYSETNGVSVEVEEISTTANGYYDRKENRIAIKAGMPDAQSARVLAHEIAHSMLHADSDDAERGDKELEAESVAFIICSHFGIETKDYSFPYVSSWTGAKGLEKLKRSAGRITKAASKIIEAIENTEMKAAA
jgi:antirestriction protein ArdC